MGNAKLRTFGRSDPHPALDLPADVVHIAAMRQPKSLNLQRDDTARESSRHRRGRFCGQSCRLGPARPGRRGGGVRQPPPGPSRGASRRRRLVEADLADEPPWTPCWPDGTWDGVLHFAALSLVGREHAATVPLPDGERRSRHPADRRLRPPRRRPLHPVFHRRPVRQPRNHADHRGRADRSRLALRREQADDRARPVLGRPHPRPALRLPALLQRRRRRPGRPVGRGPSAGDATSSRW